MRSAYHHGNLRSALLTRAEAALREVGVEELSLRQLARDIGVSHGAPARHFRDKQSLLDALALEGFTALNSNLAAAANADGTVRERFDRMARAYVSFAVQRPELLQMMFSTKHHDDASDELRATGEAGLTTVRDMIEAAQASGQIRPGDPDVLAVVIQAQVHGLAMLTTGDMLCGADPETVLVATLEQTWRGLSP